VGEIRIRRDERTRVTGFSVCGVEADTTACTSAQHLLRAVTMSLVDYLHMAVESDATELVINRNDLHLDRELDAILETLVIGLKLLAEEYPGDLVVEEATVGVEV
jgi:uncharacterized protein YsxB (DUF464 family)